jgi:hypothetical protein
MLFCIECGTSLPGGAHYCPACRTRRRHDVGGAEAGPMNAASLSVMGPEMMIAEARLASAPAQSIDSSRDPRQTDPNPPRSAVTPTVQPLVRKRLAISALVVAILAVLLLILGYMAIVIAIARIVTAAAASG